MKIMFLGANNPETGRMMRAVMRTGQDIEFAGFIDNDVRKRNSIFLGLPVHGGFEYLETIDVREYRFVNLITGSTTVRYETSMRLAEMGCRLTNFVHPTVMLDDVTMGVGNYVQEGVILQADVTIGDNSSIHMGTLVGHESRIGHSVFVAHGCSLSGLVSVGDGTFIGTHATVLPRVAIGAWSIIGAGAVIVKDVPPYSVVVGNPGRTLRANPVSYIDGAIPAISL